MKKILFSLWLLSFPVGATNFNAGLEAYLRKDYGRALEIWQKLIDNDTRISSTFVLEDIDPHEKSLAQYGVGLLYWQGLGVEQSYPQAMRWLLQAAENGHKGAALKLAVLYLEGLAGEKNEQKAAEWMLVAAQASLPDAQYNLGLMYLNGTGLIKDRQQAISWLKKASDAGVDDAAKVLAKLSSNKPAENHISAQTLNETQQKSQQLYAIQIAAMNDKEKASELSKHYAGRIALKSYRKKVKQQEWYVLLHCCFASRNEAKQALATLPAKLLTQKPFITTTSSLLPLN